MGDDLKQKDSGTKWHNFGSYQNKKSYCNGMPTMWISQPVWKQILLKMFLSIKTKNIWGIKPKRDKQQEEIELLKNQF